VPKEANATDELTKLINDERHGNRLNELKPESLLIELSRQKAVQMESEKKVSHNGFTDLELYTEKKRSDSGLWIQKRRKFAKGLFKEQDP
jgi:uncharacterized protein YkwD